MPKYQGSCHCGAVRFAYEGERIERGIRCNCSICARKGAVMSTEMIPQQALQIDAQDGALGLYQFGQRNAKHYFCRHCGIYTHHETARKAAHYRVNLGCIDGLDSTELPFDVFDGKHLL